MGTLGPMYLIYGYLDPLSYVLARVIVSSWCINMSVDIVVARNTHRGSGTTRDGLLVAVGSISFQLLGIQEYLYTGIEEKLQILLKTGLLQKPSFQQNM